MTPDALPLASPEETLGGIVAARPRAAALFEDLGLDYCCGGGKTLEDACRERNLEIAAIAAKLERLDAEADDGREHDVGALTVAELSEHIVDSHHEPARAQMDRIAQLLAKVVRAHGEHDPSTHALREHFAALQADLDQHMRAEEEELFPACRTIESGGPRPSDELLEHLQDTHSATGAALAELRELGNDYDPASAHCATHRVLLSELTAFELELHRHIHEENNILFREVRRLLAERR
jgi:regulator of cell morphogenesis and NO signaling